MPEDLVKRGYLAGRRQRIASGDPETVATTPGAPGRRIQCRAGDIRCPAARRRPKAPFATLETCSTFPSSTSAERSRATAIPASAVAPARPAQGDRDRRRHCGGLVDRLLQKGGEAIVLAPPTRTWLASHWYQNEDPKRNFENTLAKSTTCCRIRPHRTTLGRSVCGETLRAQGDLPGAMAHTDSRSPIWIRQAATRTGPCCRSGSSPGGTDEANAVLQRA